MTHPDGLAREWNALVLAGLLWVFAMAGCRHTEPFGERTFDTDQPFDPTPPVQLTLNRGHDRRAAWLPDASAILYSTQRSGVLDNDVCLAQLPPFGGRQRSLTCNFTPTGVNLTEAIESAAPGADGQLAFYRAVSSIGARIPDEQELAIGTLADPASGTRLLSIPYTIPGRRTHSGISQLRWLSPTRLLYLGEAVSVITPCQFCQPDTLRSGVEAVWLDILGGGSTPQPIPGTDHASGLSPGNTQDEIYYTLGGDTRVYHQRLSSGAVSVVHDFGTAGIARDVHVVGDRMTAVVGGRVHFTTDATFGPTQWDSGGLIHVVSLQDGSSMLPNDPDDLALFRRPQFSPDGSRLVAERHPLVLTDIRGPAGELIAVDTTVMRVADLYLFGQP